MRNMLTHPFGPLFNEDSRVLILGSFPSVKSREQNFFYGHPQNRFWKVVAAVLRQPVPGTIEEKKELILSGRLALWDVLGVPGVFSRFEKIFATKDTGVEYEIRWIDNYGDLRTRMQRFGSEAGGIVPVYHFGSARTVIEGHFAGFWNRSEPHTPIMCDSPSADAMIFCTSFSLSRQHLKRIEMLWQDGSGARHRIPQAKMSFTCPQQEP